MDLVAVSASALVMACVFSIVRKPWIQSGQLELGRKILKILQFSCLGIAVLSGIVALLQSAA